jgi:hypothetical protein
MFLLLYPIILDTLTTHNALCIINSNWRKIMTEEEFLAEGGIPLEIMTKEEDRLLMKVVEPIWKAGQFEIISEERTKSIHEEFRKLGVEEAEATRLTRHFNAACKYMREMPPDEKKKLYKRFDEGFGL